MFKRLKRNLKQEVLKEVQSLIAKENQPNLYIKLVTKDANGDYLPAGKLPTYAHDGDSGMDVYAALSKDVIIPAGETKLINTSLSIAIDKGYELQVRPRSGLALKHGITVLNTPGTVDSIYRGIVGVILHNTGKTAFIVKNGERIAQIVVAKVCTANIVETDFLPESERGRCGFGSTGTK